jgi:hypothetical protein
MTSRSRIALVAVTAVLVVLLPTAAGAEPGFSPAAPIPSLIGATSAGPGTYSSVSCATATSCTAVGPGLFANDEPASVKATAVTDNSGTWSHAALPTPAGAKKVVVNGVVCGAADDCTAVGGDETASTTSPLVETETSGTWSESNVAAPGGAEGFFNELWCASQGNCVATGMYVSKGFAGMVAVEDAGVWAPASALPAISIAGVIEVVPYAIACHDADDCTVIALAVSLSGESTVAWTETSSTWGAAVALPGVGGLTFAGVSLQCPTATTCLAVGSLENAAGTVARPASDVELSGTWATPTAVPLPKLSPVMTSGAFTSLSCTATLCEAVGALHQTANTSSETVAGAATWSDGTWSSIGLETSVQLPASKGLSSLDAAGSPEFDGVSCATDSACVGVGSFSSGDFAATIATQRTVTVPGAPVLAGGAPGVRSAMLFFTPPGNDGGSAITKFTATVEPGDKTCTTGAYHCEVSGLTDGHAYIVRVTATNAAGTGPVTHGDFIAGGPPTTPRAFHVVGWAMGAVTLAWHPSAAPPGMRVTSYVVALYVGKRLERSVFTHATTCRLTGLVAHHHYVVTLSANDLSGGSPSVSLHVIAP